MQERERKRESKRERESNKKKKRASKNNDRNQNNNKNVSSYPIPNAIKRNEKHRNSDDTLYTQRRMMTLGTVFL